MDSPEQRDALELEARLDHVFLDDLHLVTPDISAVAKGGAFNVNVNDIGVTFMEESSRMRVSFKFELVGKANEEAEDDAIELRFESNGLYSCGRLPDREAYESATDAEQGKILTPYLKILESVTLDRAMRILAACGIWQIRLPLTLDIKYEGEIRK